LLKQHLYFNYEKQIYTIPISLIIFAVFFQIACRKNENINKDEIVTAETIQKLKDWHTEKTKTLTSTSEDKKLSQSIQESELNSPPLEPAWDSAKYEILSNGEKVISIPTPQFKNSNEHVSSFRKLLYKINNGKVESGFIVEIYGKQDIIKKLNNQIFINQKSQRIAGFDGALIYFDENYKYVDSRVYKNGELAKGFSLVIKGNLKTSSKNADKRVASTIITSGRKVKPAGMYIGPPTILMVVVNLPIYTVIATPVQYAAVAVAVMVIVIIAT
jgi:hypothetical protein